MANNHFLIALRRACAEKAYVAINVFTLALGLASVILVAAYVRSELTYDRHHADYRRIHRIVSDFTGPGGETHSALSSSVLGPLLVKEFPQFADQVRIMTAPPEVMLRYENREKRWDHLVLADPNVFEVLSHDILQGDPKTALAGPFSLAISESVARFYFGETDPLGKTFTVVGFPFKVTLVFADLPQNVHLRYDAMFSTAFANLVLPGFNEMPTARLWSTDFGTHTYLKLRPGADADEFQALMKRFVDKYMSGPRPAAAAGVSFNARLQPIADAHFGEKLQFDAPTGNIAYVLGFSAIAFFLLTTACINYMNLATARAARRAREVGMRKVMGATRASLVRHFLAESLLYSVFGLIVALVMVEVTLPLTPVAELLAGRQLAGLDAKPDIAVGLAILVPSVALMSGLYPAFYLSAMAPSSALSHGRKSWRTGFTLRQVLVAVQLGISIGVIVCVGLMMSQMRFIHEKPLGFEKHNQLLVRMFGEDAARQLPVLKEELARLPGVRGSSRVAAFPLANNANDTFGIENTDGALEQVQVVPLWVDPDFLETLKIEMAGGRGFSMETPTDLVQAAIVNETLVKRMGWKQPLGMRVSRGRDETARVIGVVKDFHYASLHNAVEPMVMFPFLPADGPTRGTAIQNAVAQRTMVIALSGRDMQGTLRSVTEVFERLIPSFRFEPVFLEDEINQLYRVEAALMKLAALFAAVCVALSIVGIAALSSFMTEQRAREIGIRKVLGASARDILAMLCRPLPLLVLAAAVPASLVAFRAMEAWLERFPYRIEIDPAAFVGATLLIMLVALVTVALQASRVLRADPAESLRYE